MSISGFAVGKISKLLGLPESEVRQAILPGLESITDPYQVIETLKDLLGNSEASSSFIDEYIQRRFPAFIRKKDFFPTQDQFQHAKLIIQKAGKKTSQKERKKFTSNSGSPMTTDSEIPAKILENSCEDPTTLPESGDSKERRRRKKKNASENDEQKQQQVNCGCAAIEHALFTNCLNCGRIHCLKESGANCLFCTQPLSPRKNVRKEQNEDYEAASAHKNRLLEFQNSHEQRTRVIDQVSDFSFTTDANKDDLWLTKEEREIVKKEREKREALMNQSKMGKARVVTLDLKTGRLVENKQIPLVIEKNATSAPTPAPAPEPAVPAKSSEKPPGTMLFAANPLINPESRPIYKPSVTQSTSSSNETFKKYVFPGLAHVCKENTISSTRGFQSIADLIINKSHFWHLARYAKTHWE